MNLKYADLVFKIAAVCIAASCIIWAVLASLLHYDDDFGTKGMLVIMGGAIVVSVLSCIRDLCQDKEDANQSARIDSRRK